MECLHLANTSWTHSYPLHTSLLLAAVDLKSQPASRHGEVSDLGILVELNKYLLSKFEVLGTVDRTMNKYHRAPALTELTVQWEEKDLETSHYNGT